jgi:hypothetical protein
MTPEERKSKYEELKKSLATDRDGDTGLKKALKAIVAPLGLLTGCGAREIGDAGEAVALKFTGNPVVNQPLPDVRFDNKQDNYSLLQEIIAQAKEDGAWDKRKNKFVPSIEVNDMVEPAVARCFQTADGGGLRLTLTKDGDNYPRASKKRLIAHELGHCLWDERDEYDPSRRDDLMYGYGAASALDPEEFEAATEAYKVHLADYIKNYHKGNTPDKVREILRAFFQRQ